MSILHIPFGSQTLYIIQSHINRRDYLISYSRTTIKHSYSLRDCLNFEGLKYTACLHLNSFLLSFPLVSLYAIAVSIYIPFFFYFTPKISVHRHSISFGRT